jgi:hypothetical protein
LSYVARHFRHLRSRPPQPAPPFPPPPGSFGRMGLSIPIASGRSWLTARLPVELRLSSSRSCLATGDTTRDGPLHHDGPRHLAWPAPPHPPPRAALPHPPLRRGPSLQPPPPPATAHTAPGRPCPGGSAELRRKRSWARAVPLLPLVDPVCARAEKIASRGHSRNIASRCRWIPSRDSEVWF